MIPEADSRRLGVGKRESAAGRVGGLGRRRRRTVAPAVIRATIGPWRELGFVAHGRQDQSRRAHQSEKMHPGDHEHQLDVA